MLNIDDNGKEILQNLVREYGLKEILISSEKFILSPDIMPLLDEEDETMNNYYNHLMLMEFLAETEEKIQEGKTFKINILESVLDISEISSI